MAVASASDYKLGSHVTYVTAGTRIMEEDVVINHLSDPSFDRRSKTLEYLRGSARRHGGQLAFANLGDLFEALALSLVDSNWDVRYQCIQLLYEIIPGIGDDVDDCMAVILPKLIPNLGDSKITVRRAVIQSIHVYMKCTNIMSLPLNGLIKYGIESDEPKVRRESIVALPMLFTPEFSHEDFSDVLQALAKRLLDSEDHNNILLAIDKIRNLVSDPVFNTYLQKLSTPLRKYYLKLTGRDLSEIDSLTSVSRKEPKNDIVTPRIGPHIQQSRSHSSSNNSVPKEHFVGIDDTDQHLSKQLVRDSHFKASYEFGFVPSHLMDKLYDQTNFRSRAQAVEELKSLVRDLQNIHVLTPNMLHFISFLDTLLDDANFKITTVTLEIFCILVDKLNVGIKPFMKSVIAALTKRMGDNKIVVKQAILKVVMKAMQILSPQPVLVMVCENLTHRNSRVRQETLNLCIASLLTFPSYDFELGQLCQIIAPTLIDSKRQVRQAALECFAVLAQAMGAGKLGPLVQAVDGVELSYEGNGVMAAVQARLARRQLPRLAPDGLVEYTTPVPSSAASSTRGATSIPQGADIEWILAASGSGGGSARSHRSDAMEVESITSNSARSTPRGIIEENVSNAAPRRYHSAGRRRSKLPWEDSDNEESASVANGNNGVQNGFHPPGSAPINKGKNENSAHPPLKPRSTWSGEDLGPAINAGIPEVTRKLRRKPEESSDSEALRRSVASSETDDEGRKSLLPSRMSIPGAWHNKVEDSAMAPNRPVLQPIHTSDSNTSLPFQPDWSDPADKTDESPIPLKASLARTGTAKVVPPIGASQEPSNAVSREEESLTDAEQIQMGYLRTIRNSATKKKAQKIFQNLEKKQKSNASSSSSRSPSPPTDTSESGFFSTLTTMSNNSELDSSSKSSKKNDSPFTSKPRLARKESQPRNEDSFGLKSDSKSDINQMEYNPLGGVTFRENNNSDVHVVGRGYAEDSSPTDHKPALTSNSRPRERRRMTKGSLLSPLGMAAMHAHGAVEMDEDRVPGGVVGKSVFESASPSSSDHKLDATASSSSLADSRDRRTSRHELNEQKNLPRGVYGIGVRQNSQNFLEKQAFMDSMEDGIEEDEDPANISFSKTTSERMAQKIQQKAEEVEQRRLERERRQRVERERKQREAEEKRRKQEDDRQKEKERQQEKLRRLSSNNSEIAIDSLAISGAQAKPPPGKPSGTSAPNTGPPTARKQKLGSDGSDRKITPASGGQTPLSASINRAPTEPEQLEDLAPFNNPEHALKEALRLMSDEDWETKMSGITCVRRLALHHPATVCAHLHGINLALIQEVKNLRSQVSRLAIVCMGDMYTCLKKNMDADLDLTTRILLAKSGESSGFIREDVDKALDAMANSVTTQRAMQALIAGGSAHRSTSVRKTTAQYLSIVVEKIGVGRVLSGIKDLTDKILPVIAIFTADSSAETRYFGRKMLDFLMSHEDFEQMLRKHVQGNNLRSVLETVEALRRKGLGDMPCDTPSARLRRSGPQSRGSSATSVTDSLPSSASGSKRLSESTSEQLKQITTALCASDWRERYKGCTTLLELCNSNTEAVGSNIIKIFDKFGPTVRDSNSKVNLYALQVLLHITPLLRDYMSSVINMTCQTVVQNLSSKNKDIHNTASDVLDAFMEHLDASLLLQPFANQAQVGNARIKPDLVERVSYLITKIYSRKQKQVLLHGLPLLYHLLGISTGSGAVPGNNTNIRQATVHLVHSLHSQMGDALMEQASNNTNVTPRHLQMLQDIIDNP